MPYEHHWPRRPEDCRASSQWTCPRESEPAPRPPPSTRPVDPACVPRSQLRPWPDQCSRYSARLDERRRPNPCFSRESQPDDARQRARHHPTVDGRHARRAHGPHDSRGDPDAVRRSHSLAVSPRGAVRARHHPTVDGRHARRAHGPHDSRGDPDAVRRSHSLAVSPRGAVRARHHPTVDGRHARRAHGPHDSRGDPDAVHDETGYQR